jgi:hypothetical protein
VSPIAARLRGAVEAQDYGAARRLLDEYARRLDARAPQALLEEAAELFEWIRRMTLAGREGAVAELADLPPAYGRRRAGRGTWQILG